MIAEAKDPNDPRIYILTKEEYLELQRRANDAEVLVRLQREKIRTLHEKHEALRYSRGVPRTERVSAGIQRRNVAQTREIARLRDRLAAYEQAAVTFLKEAP